MWRRRGWVKSESQEWRSAVVRPWSLSRNGGSDGVGGGAARDEKGGGVPMAWMGMRMRGSSEMVSKTAGSGRRNEVAR